MDMYRKKRAKNKHKKVEAERKTHAVKFVFTVSHKNRCSDIPLKWHLACMGVFWELA